MDFTFKEFFFFFVSLLKFLFLQVSSQLGASYYKCLATTMILLPRIPQIDQWHNITRNDHKKHQWYLWFMRFYCTVSTMQKHDFTQKFSNLDSWVSAYDDATDL
jgi:hypothetical protein